MSMDKKTGDSFTYTYSAKEQEEIKKIRSKYIAPEEDKMTQLRKLDAAVYSKATMLSLMAGIIGTLVMGVGMCCCLVWAGFWFVPGIIIGLLGIALVCLAYPLYSKTVKKEREKIAPEIIKLTDELMK